MNKLQNFTQFINEAGRNRRGYEKYENSVLLDLKIPNIGSLDPYEYIFTKCLEDIYGLDSGDIDHTLEYFFDHNDTNAQEYFNENCKIHYPSKTIFIATFYRLQTQFENFNFKDKSNKKISFWNFDKNIFYTICKYLPKYKDFTFSSDIHYFGNHPDD